MRAGFCCADGLGIMARKGAGKAGYCSGGARGSEISALSGAQGGYWCGGYLGGKEALSLCREGDGDG